MVHVLINNAGIVQGKSFLDMNEALVHKSMIINLECHFWFIREFLPDMLKKDEGQIVSVASMAGVSGQPDMTDYCASKFGAVGLMESLRVELRKRGANIKCTTITPYYINTGLFDGVRCSPIYPLLEQDATVERMINGILQDEEMISIPWSMGFLNKLLGSILPPHVMDYVLKIVIGWDAMS